MSQRLGMVRPPDAVRTVLLFLLGVHRVLAQASAVFAQLQFLAAGFAPHGVVVITGFFAHQKHGFRFLFALSHDFLLTPKQVKLAL
jgi:hypothetical protein